MISRTIQSDLTNEVVILLRTVWFLIVASLLFSSGSSQAGTIPFFDTANRPGNINVGTVIKTSQNGYWKVTAGSYYAGEQTSESVYVYNDDSLIKLSYLTSGVTFTVEQITPTKIDSVLRPGNMNPGTILLATSGDVWKIVTGSYYGGSAQQEQVVIYIASGKTYMSFDTSGVVMEVLLVSIGCSYIITPTTQTFTSAVGTGSVNITATPSPCSGTWTATSNASWITITSNSSGTGNGTVYYSVSANTSTSSRTGTINIQGQTFTVYQSGITCTAPAITTQPQSQTIQSGQTATLSVTATGTSLSYQWYRGSSGDTSSPVGTNSSSYTTPALTQTTSYWVRVSNSCGNVDSNTATITMTTISFMTNTDSVTVPEGGTGTFQVKLSAQPSSTVYASVSRYSGDSDISVQSGSSLTFTSSNWSSYQTVTLSAAEDADTTNGTATIRISASGLPNKDITATESDNDRSYFSLADYNGDGATDVAAFHLPTDQFFTDYAGNLGQFGWGGSDSMPLIWDYDGDGKTDVSIYHIPTNQWFVKGVGNLGQFGWGGVDSIPVPGDYNGDGRMEWAFYHSPTNRWFVEGQDPVQFGWNGEECIPLPGDYDGDGKTDIVIYHIPSNQWFLYGVGNLGQFGWGGADCIPVPGDYNGDGKTEIAVYHIPTNQWLVKGIGNLGQYGWGGLESFPIPGDYNGDGVMERGFYRPSENRWFIEGESDFVWGWGGSDFMPITSQIAVYNWFRFKLHKFE